MLGCGSFTLFGELLEQQIFTSVVVDYVFKVVVAVFL
jgi:hypothetical protein